MQQMRQEVKEQTKMISNLQQQVRPRQGQVRVKFRKKDMMIISKSQDID